MPGNTRVRKCQVWNALAEATEGKYVLVRIRARACVTVQTFFPFSSLQPL